jgi:hypothetical protein
MAAHYIGLAYALWVQETYEWEAYRGVFPFVFPQVLIYLWGQFILWRRFYRDRDGKVGDVASLCRKDKGSTLEM